MKTVNLNFDQENALAIVRSYRNVKTRDHIRYLVELFQASRLQGKLILYNMLLRNKVYAMLLSIRYTFYTCG